MRDAAARGLRVILTIGGAPGWAQQGTPPPTAGAGTWKPDPVALGQFARAAATRYSGMTADPGLPGALLPAVRAWQIWNEPNLSVYLTPQWENGRPFAADHYRAMLAAAYDAIKAVEPRERGGHGRHRSRTATTPAGGGSGRCASGASCCACAAASCDPSAAVRRPGSTSPRTTPTASAGRRRTR